MFRLSCTSIIFSFYKNELKTTDTQLFSDMTHNKKAKFEHTITLLLQAYYVSLARLVDINSNTINFMCRVVRVGLRPALSSEYVGTYREVENGPLPKVIYKNSWFINFLVLEKTKLTEHNFDQKRCVARILRRYGRCSSITSSQSRYFHYLERCQSKNKIF